MSSRILSEIARTQIHDGRMATLPGILSQLHNLLDSCDRTSLLHTDRLTLGKAPCADRRQCLRSIGLRGVHELLVSDLLTRPLRLDIQLLLRVFACRIRLVQQEPFHHVGRFASHLWHRVAEADEIRVRMIPATGPSAPSMLGPWPNFLNFLIQHHSARSSTMHTSYAQLGTTTLQAMLSPLER